MEKDKIFFSEQGLTSTSANYIANNAKEFIQTLECAINNIEFYTGKVTLIGSNNTQVISEGINNTQLDKIYGMLDQIYKAKSLIAWLRAGIKAREFLIDNIRTLSLKQFCQSNDIEYPEEPKEP